MNGTRWVRAFQWVFSRVGIVYAVLFFLAISLIDVKAVSMRIQMGRLNDARPEMGSLVSFMKGEVPADKMDWEPYLEYFSLVVKRMPQEEVSQMFLGVCEFYSGDKKKSAWEHVLHSAEGYPFIFWNLYDAGVLAFARGDMSTAVLYLERALIIPTDKAEAAILGSVVYRQVMASSNFDIRIQDEISGARADVHLLLAAAKFYSGEHEQARNVALYPIGKMPVKDEEPFYFYAGAASLALGRPAEALFFMGKCIELKSRNPLVYRYAGELLKSSGKMDAAAGMFRSAEALQPRVKGVFPYPERLRLRFI